MAAPLNQIQPSVPKRLKIGIPVLDEQFGGGAPIGKISTLSGESGAGKSRLSTVLAVHLNKQRLPIYYVTTELPPNEFSGEKLGGYASHNFFINRTKSLKEIVDDILEVRPRWVFIDSINLVREFRGGRGGEDIVDGFQDGLTYQHGLRWAAEQVGAHITCISQQNTDGSIKGGTSFTHMGDMNFYLNKCKAYVDSSGRWSGVFQVKSGKNRYGKSDMITYWKHEATTVICLGSEAPVLPELKAPQERSAKDGKNNCRPKTASEANLIDMNPRERAAFEKGRYKGGKGLFRWFMEGLTGKYID